MITLWALSLMVDSYNYNVRHNTFNAIMKAYEITEGFKGGSSHHQVEEAGTISEGKILDRFRKMGRILII